MTGTIVQVLGPVVDVAFTGGQLPRIRDALYTQADGRDVVMEVSQHLGDGIVRCILLSPPEGLTRDLSVEPPGGGIAVPVGRQCLGRLFGVFGQRDKLQEENAELRAKYDGLVAGVKALKNKIREEEKRHAGGRKSGGAGAGSI